MTEEKLNWFLLEWSTRCEERGTCDECPEGDKNGDSGERCDEAFDWFARQIKNAGLPKE